ncbi:Uncharacterized protein FKW44_001427 [Caligus rogercresseyi]|uniref:Uncharacterized protein n=1 Tax=Caligus rogercresseyi TaxID=217165 RepID=A0A7T8KIX4_CALRO|nr:Uncharacterized protein FKW44_001427 [Caligus rogercresseyi]
MSLRHLHNSETNEEEPSSNFPDHEPPPTPVPSCSSLLNGCHLPHHQVSSRSQTDCTTGELTDNPRSNGGGGSTVLFDDHSNNLAVNNKNNNTSPLPNFRLNFVKKMEDSLILRLPQGSCDTTPDTPDSLDDDSVDHTSLPPTPVPIPVSDLPLPKPPLSTQNHEPAK